jgi:hypothetical protein
VFYRVFGSFTKALQAAGMQRKLSMTQQELIRELWRLKRMLGRVPTQKDVDAASKQGNGACTGSYIRVFGSFSAAKYAAWPSLRSKK